MNIPISFMSDISLFSPEPLKLLKQYFVQVSVPRKLSRISFTRPSFMSHKICITCSSAFVSCMFIVSVFRLSLLVTVIASEAKQSASLIVYRLPSLRAKRSNLLLRTSLLYLLSFSQSFATNI